MAKSTSVCNSILALIYNATAWADIAENDGSGPISNVYVRLHTGDPGVGGLQTTNEVAYDGYNSLQVVRSTSGWEIPVNGETSNAALAQFVACGELTTIPVSISHVSIGKAAYPSAGLVFHAGALAVPRNVSAGIQPQFAENALVIRET
jgi:hypothetical protein